MNRKGNSRHNAYLSSLPLFLLPTPLWHPFFSSFLFRWQKLSDSSDSFHTGRWLDREFLQPRLKTKSNPKSSILPVLIYIYFSNSLHNRCLVCLPVFVNHGNHPFHIMFHSFKNVRFHMPKHLSESELIWRQKGDGLLPSSCIFLSSDNLSTLHIIKEGELSERGEWAHSCGLKLQHTLKSGSEF